MFDLTFNIPTLLTAGLTIIAFVVWLVRLEARVAASHLAAEQAEEEARQNALKVDAAHALVLLHEKQFHAYQLSAAKEFVTQSTLSEIKRELLTEFGRIETRLESHIGRLLKDQP